MSNKNNFAVISFCQKDENGKDQIELVPNSWLKEEGEKTLCLYPDGKDYQWIEKWVLENRRPDPSWDQFPVKVISTTGIRRLKRACYISEVESENSCPKKKMSKLNIPSKANVKKNLDSCKYASNRNIDVKSISDDTDSESTDKTGFVKSPLKRKNNMLPKNVNNSEATSYNDTADDNADDTTKDKELKDALKKIVRIEIRKSTMQLQIDLNNHFKVLNDNLSMNLNLNRGIDKDSIFNCTGVKLPIQSLDDFKMFDEKLTTEEEFLKNILKPFLVDKATTSSNFKDAIHKILKSLMTTDLQKLYTACGRTSAFGTKKLRFIDTNVYKCMTEVLLSVFSGQASSEAIQSNTSRWLSGAMDRDNEEKIDTMRMLKICYVFLVCVLLIVIILSF